jgi:uncharacterized NAD(P)/FAD-binding protein YdhS
MNEVDVAIVGGGFSGCAVAAHLARYSERAVSVTLFEPDALGRGAAYGTPHSEHLLNTRAHQMSLYSGEPEHFVRWLGGRAGPMDFVSRQLYGTYVAEIAASVFGRRGFAHVPHRVQVVRAAGEGFVVETRDDRYGARTVVLATGNQLPRNDFLPAAVLAHRNYVADPWRFDYRAVRGPVLLVGSGLTALDAVVALRSCGHRERMHVISRHGRFPELHALVPPYDVVPALDTSATLALLRSFRRHLREASARGFDWRAVVDALRGESEAIWRRLPESERRRFERHLRARWERHRHRAPPQVRAVADADCREGRLRVYAGRLRGVVGGRATIDLRDGRVARPRAEWIVNCSGLGPVASSCNPALGGLLADGTLSPDPSGFGVRATSELAAIDARGRVARGLWIVGPPARGSRFEATSVPELRAMAELAATGILSRLKADAYGSPSWARTL